jgi:hypothetical protein
MVITSYTSNCLLPCERIGFALSLPLADRKPAKSANEVSSGLVVYRLPDSKNKACQTQIVARSEVVAFLAVLPLI